MSVQWFQDARTGEHYYYSFQENCYVYEPSGRRVYLPQRTAQRTVPQSVQGLQQSGQRAASVPTTNGIVTSTVPATQTSAYQMQPSASSWTDWLYNPLAALNRGSQSSSTGQVSQPATASRYAAYKTTEGPTAGGSSITDPSVVVGKSNAAGPSPGLTGRRITGTEGDYEPLDPRYKMRREGRRYYKSGRIFKVYWPENVGYDDSSSVVTTSREYVQDRKHGQWIYSKYRCFVVIREGDQHCQCLPILTYGAQGVAKSGVKKSDHAVIYTGSQPPEPKPSERPTRAEQTGMRIPIRAVPDDLREKLDEMSRINYGRVYTVEHNVKSRSFGWVHKDSERTLHYTFREVFMSSMPQAVPRSEQRANVTPSLTGRADPSRLDRNGTSSQMLQPMTQQKRQDNADGESGESSDEEDAEDEEAAKVTLADLIRKSRAYRELLAEHGQRHTAVARDPRYSLLIAKMRKKLEEDSD